MSFSRRWRAAIAPAAMAITLIASACAPTPAPTAAPAAPAAAAPKLILDTTTVQGSKNIPVDQRASGACILTNRFARNSEIVWRVRIYDPRTGDLMDDKAVSKAQVKLTNGQALEMRYGKHGQTDDAPWFWTTSWVVPKDAATGTLNYTITATAADGRVGEYKPLAVAPSLLTVTETVLPDVVEPTPAPKPKA